MPFDDIELMAPSAPKNEFVRTVEALENNIVDRIASVLNEKNGWSG